MTGSSTLGVVDIDPFGIDPLIMSRANARNIPVLVFAVACLVSTMLLNAFCALVSGRFFPTTEEVSQPWAYLWAFIRFDSSAEIDSVSYLVDIPSLVLSVVIPVVMTTVYALFRHVKRLHTDMEEHGCIRFNVPIGGLAAFNSEATALNNTFRTFGRSSPIVLGFAVAIAALINIRQRQALYDFVGSSSLYQSWWASLWPIRPGGVLWITIGGVGIYAFYAQAILGLSYLSFLRRFRGQYTFRGNPTNPDGYFGWSRLRSVITNLEVGLILTAVATWGVSYLLLPGFGAWAMVLFLVAFVGVAAYVFFGVTIGFRRQASADREEQIMELERVITKIPTNDVAALLSVSVAYQRLQLVSALPSTPIRRSWFLVGLITAGVPIAALILQLLQYATDVNK